MKVSPAYYLNSTTSLSTLKTTLLFLAATSLHSSKRGKESMEMIKISQVLKLLLLIASLLIITLLLFTSLRTTYLYFIVNLLIVSLGAEAGLISFFCKSPNDKKLSSTNIIITQKQHNMTTPVIYFPPSGTSEHQETAPKAKYDHLASTESSLLTTKNNTGYKVVEKCASEKIFGVAEVHEQVALVKKCPSMPSLFFIGDTGEETNEGHEILKEEKYDDQNDEEAVVPSKQELFYKAETFIGNFYKQLKMQREESWKSLHDFYHKAAF